MTLLILQVARNFRAFTSSDLAILTENVQSFRLSTSFAHHEIAEILTNTAKQQRPKAAEQATTGNPIIINTSTVSSIAK
jgi:hypothetical protein